MYRQHMCFIVVSNCILINELPMYSNKTSKTSVKNRDDILSGMKELPGDDFKIIKVV